jgi:predicted ArsR family transcriptional regulator
MSDRITSSQLFQKARKGRRDAAKQLFGKLVVDHLLDCSRVFGGDLVQIMLLAIIERFYCDAIIAHGRTPLPPGAGRVSASYLASIAKIPRETVRRKLSRLAERGCAEQAEDHTWRLAVDGAGRHVWRELAELDERGLKRLAELQACLESVLPRKP